MLFEVVCFTNSVETSRSPYTTSLQSAYLWLRYNVKSTEDAEIRAFDNTVEGLKINAAIAHFHGLQQYT